ncbi:MAG: ribosome small subunit-dependent GTPase A [Thermaurantimonas sp.]|uniref:ribosome small subunit-dependent GTPase A n=1 Tax=Thermaurantimonas sp. TaxID=2681568 RepID=UPI0039194E9E
MKGRILKSTGSFYIVEIEDQVVSAKLKGKLRLLDQKNTNPVAVGDMVELVLGKKGECLIERVYERKNYLIRRSVNLSKQTHIIASNIDQALLIVTPVYPETSFGFIDRFLVTCEAYSIPAYLILNKADLFIGELSELLEGIEYIYHKVGYPTLRTSAIEGTGLEELKMLLKDKISLLSGHSGVGKSSLVNAISPGLNLKTGQISDYHFKGTHTTTFAEMHRLSFGGYVIDTPGIKGFGLVDMTSEELSDYFPEMLRLKANCRFNNCLHINEPDCAVRAGVEEGTVPETRYHSYLNMLEEEKTGPYRVDDYQ